MKKIKVISLAATMALLGATSASFADHHDNNEKDSHESNVKSTMVQFMALGLGSFGVNKASDAMGCDATSQAVMHLSNVMIQGGMIFGKPVLTDLGFRAMLGSTAGSVANTRFIRDNLKDIPFVGEHLSDAGSRGISLTTIAFYELLKQGYIKVVDRMPENMQNMVRGE